MVGEGTKEDKEAAVERGERAVEAPMFCSVCRSSIAPRLVPSDSVGGGGGGGVGDVGVGVGVVGVVVVVVVVVVVCSIPFVTFDLAFPLTPTVVVIQIRGTHSRLFSSIPTL